MTWCVISAQYIIVSFSFIRLLTETDVGSELPLTSFIVTLSVLGTLANGGVDMFSQPTAQRDVRETD